MTILETQLGALVNMNNVFDIVIAPENSATYDNKTPEVWANSPGEPLRSAACLFTGNTVEDCKDYIAWLKQQLAVPRSFIPHTYAPPQEVSETTAWYTWGEIPEGRVPGIGDTVFWRQDGTWVSGTLTDYGQDQTLIVTCRKVHNLHIPEAWIHIPNDSSETD